MFQRYSSMLRKEFDGYGAHDLAHDIVAGLAVGAVSLPLALAFGVSAGAGATAGLITAILSGLIISPLGGAFYQISGPTGAMAAVLLTVIAKHSLTAMFLVTLLAGILRLAFGLLRLGKLTAYIPAPVVGGFTAGIAIIIVSSQIDPFFGVSSTGFNVIDRLKSYAELGFSPDLTCVVLAVLTMLFVIFFPKKWANTLPVSLFAILFATFLCFVFSLDVPVVGEIPKTLLPADRLRLSDIRLASLPPLFLPALSIAMLGMFESLLCGEAAAKITKVRLENNLELIAQGIGNIVFPFFGGMPSTAAFSRTSVGIRSGARTRLTGVFQAVTLLLFMFLLGPLMARIPLSALAGVLMVVAFRMNDWPSIRYMFSRRFKGAMLKFFATMAATIVIDLTTAVFIGVAIGLVLTVAKLSKIEVNYEKVDLERADIQDPLLQERYCNTMVAYITGPILFAGTEDVEAIAENLAGADTLLLSVRGVSHLDVSGAQCLIALVQTLHERGIDVACCGVSKSAMHMFRRSSLYDLIGEDCFYWSVTNALLDCRPRRGCCGGGNFAKTEASLSTEHSGDHPRQA